MVSDGVQKRGPVAHDGLDGEADPGQRGEVTGEIADGGREGVGSLRQCCFGSTRGARAGEGAGDPQLYAVNLDDQRSHLDTRSAVAVTHFDGGRGCVHDTAAGGNGEGDGGCNRVQRNLYGEEGGVSGLIGGHQGEDIASFLQYQKLVKVLILGEGDGLPIQCQGGRFVDLACEPLLGLIGEQAVGRREERNEGRQGVYGTDKGGGIGKVAVEIFEAGRELDLPFGQSVTRDTGGGFFLVGAVHDQLLCAHLNVQS